MPRVAQLFDSLLAEAPSGDADEAQDDDEDNAEVDSWEGKEQLLKLLEFCALKSKAEMMKKVLCEGAFDGAGKDACINSKCAACGFKKLWSEGLRRHVVDAEGNVKASAPVEFQSEVRWTRIRSSKKTEPGEAKQPNYEEHTGTIVQFLDEFERDVMRKYPHHRFTIIRQTEMASEFERQRCPGWLQFDVDFAMDGEILPPQGQSIQSDHWSPMGHGQHVQSGPLGRATAGAWPPRRAAFGFGLLYRL